MAGVVTFVFDDGYSNLYKIAHPIFQSQGVKGTVALIGGAISGNYITDSGPGECLDIKLQPKQIMEMAQSGAWEFVSHSMFHYVGMNWILDNWGVEAETYDLAESKRILEMMGIRGTGLIYPGGGYSDALINLAKNYYSYGRTIGYTIQTLPVPAADLWKMNSWAVLNNGTAVTKTQQGIDLAASTNGWCNLYFHGIVDTAAEVPTDPNRADYYVTKSQLQQIITYAKSKGVQIKTIAEVLNLNSTPLPVNPSLGAGNFNYWAVMYGKNWPTGWSVLKSQTDSLGWTNVQPDSGIVKTGVKSCKITATAPGEGVERILFDQLPETLEISVYPTSGRFKLQLVDFNRNPIAHSDPSDVLQTSNLNQWNTLRKVVPNRDPADTYFQIVSMDANAVGYVDDMKLAAVSFLDSTPSVTLDRITYDTITLDRSTSPKVIPAAASIGSAYAPLAARGIAVPAVTSTGQAYAPKALSPVQVPVATSTGRAYVPVPVGVVKIPVATSTGQAIVPKVIRILTVPAAASTGMALAPVATLEVSVIPAATSTGNAIPPRLVVTVKVPAAVSTGKAYAPSTTPTRHKGLKIAWTELPERYRWTELPPRFFMKGDEAVYTFILGDEKEVSALLRAFDPKTGTELMLGVDFEITSVTYTFDGSEELPAEHDEARVFALLKPTRTGNNLPCLFKAKCTPTDPAKNIETVQEPVYVTVRMVS